MFGSCTKENDLSHEFIKESNYTANRIEPDQIKVNHTIVADYSARVVLDWFDLVKMLTKETEGYTPPVAARAFGYTGLALYESLVEGIPNKNSLSGQLNEFKIRVKLKNGEHHWPSVANAALYTMINYFYSNTTKKNVEKITNLHEKYIAIHRTSATKEVINKSINLGNEVAKEILNYAKYDGGYEAYLHNFPDNYAPTSSIASWIPTPPYYSPALQPYWGSNRPFLSENIEPVQPIEPPEFSANTNSLFYKRAMEAYLAVNNLTREQKIIAEFWADDPTTTATPPGHSISILNQLLKENKSNLAFAVEAYAKLSIALSDAFISCWKTKYETSVLRPVTYINKYIDPSWESFLITPPFPEYTSGHSVQSGALAVILTDLFGEKYTFYDKTHIDRTDINGEPREFSNFYEMAEEAAISRLYGGIHYHEAIYLGLEQGYKIGENINNLKF